MSRPSTVTCRSSGSRSSSSSRTSPLNVVRRRGLELFPPLLEPPASRTHRSGGSVALERRYAMRARPRRRRDRVQPTRSAGPRQPLDPPVGHGDPPQLVGAVDRCAEMDPATARRRRQAGPSPVVTSLFIPEPGMRSWRPDRFRPPVGVASDRPRRTARCRCGFRPHPPSDGRGPRCAAIGQPGRAVNIERGPRVIAVTVRVADVHDVDVPVGSGARSASRRRFEVKAIRRPSGDQAGSPSGTRPSVSRRAWPVATSTSHRCPTLSYVKPSPLSM